MQIDELRRALLDAAGEEPPSDPDARAAVDRRVRRHHRAVVAFTAGIAVVLVALAVGAFVAVRGDDRVVPADDVSRREGVQMEVFMVVGATTEQVETVRRVLTGDPDVVDIEFVSQAQAVEEFRKLFADQPELPSSVEVGDLPASFRVRLVAGADEDAFTGRMKGVVGVDEVLAADPLARGTATACQMGEALARSVGPASAEVEVFLVLDAAPEQEAVLRAALEADPDLVEVVFESPSQKFEDLQRMFSDLGIPPLVEEAQLPASFRLTVGDGVDADDVADRYSGLPGVANVRTADAWLSGLDWKSCMQQQQLPAP